MLIVGFICSHIVVFMLGWWLCGRTIQAHIRREIMQETTPFIGEELERLKKFVRYEEKQP